MGGITSTQCCPITLSTRTSYVERKGFGKLWLGWSHIFGTTAFWCDQHSIKIELITTAHHKLAFQERLCDEINCSSTIDIVQLEIVFEMSKGALPVNVFEVPAVHSCDGVNVNILNILLPFSCCWRKSQLGEPLSLPCGNTKMKRHKLRRCGKHRLQEEILCQSQKTALKMNGRNGNLLLRVSWTWRTWKRQEGPAIRAIC